MTEVILMCVVNFVLYCEYIIIILHCKVFQKCVIYNNRISRPTLFTRLEVQLLLDRANIPLDLSFSNLCL